MHERLIAEELLHQAVALAREKGLSQITCLRVGLGAASHETGEALRFWFDLVRAGTMAEKASLEIDKGEGRDILLMALQGEAPDGP